MTPVLLEPAASRSRVKHSTTELPDGKIETMTVVEAIARISTPFAIVSCTVETL